MALSKINFSGAGIKAPTTLTDAATITPDFANNNVFTVTLGGNRTIANPANTEPGQSGSIFLIQDSTGGRTVSWGNYWEFPANSAPTISSAPDKIDRIDYIVRATSNVHAVFTGDY